MFRKAIPNPTKALNFGLRIATQQQIRQAPRASIFRTAQPSIAKWYSSETQAEPAKNDDGKAPEEESNGKSKAKGKAKESKESSVVAELKKKLEAKDYEVLKWQDKAMRCVADFQNLQTRTAREVAAAREAGVFRIAKDLLDTIDNLDRALSNISTEKLEALKDTSPEMTQMLQVYEGFQMTEKTLMGTLEKYGLERVDPLGEKLDPNSSEAMSTVPVPGKEDGTVCHVEQKGFKLNGKVLRSAKVIVVKNK